MKVFLTKPIGTERLSGQAKELLFELEGIGYIAGGYARQVFDPDHSPKATDIDIFLYKDNDFAYNPVDTDIFELDAAVDNVLQELGYTMTRDLPNALEYKKCGLVEVGEQEYRSIVNKNLKASIYHSDWDGSTHYKLAPLANYLPVQVIKPFTNKGLVDNKETILMKTYGQPDELMQLFDFDVAMVALEAKTYDPQGFVAGNALKISASRVVATYADTFLESNAAHKLHINHINCPVAVLLRVLKFYNKGYFISTKDLIKLFKDWQSRPESYRNRLIELCEKEELDSRQWFELEELLRID